MEHQAIPELLAPAGNLEKLKIAVLYGADAVYLAGPRFSLRAGTDNFSDEELEEGVAFAHERGVKVYVTLNSFPHDDELLDLPGYVKFLEACSVDAVIVSDAGILSVAQRHSKLAIHLSTQASCLNSHAAALWKNLGAQRIVLGRELSIEQAQVIRERAGIEVEMFIHGSMCMAYSGNCTISNYTLGRDSNRGGCAQSCRFPYSIRGEKNERGRELEASVEKMSFMSSKDLRGLALLPRFVEAGVRSLKIEGRMKSNLYVATTVRTYAAALRKYRERAGEMAIDQPRLSAELEKVPHRPYTQGSLTQPAGADSIYNDKEGGDRNNSRYEMAGTIVEVKPGYLTLLAQNPFCNQDVLEILSFDGSTIPLPAGDLKNIHHQAIPHCQASSLVVLPIAGNAQPLNLVRKSVR